MGNDLRAQVAADRAARASGGETGRRGATVLTVSSEYRVAWLSSGPPECLSRSLCDSEQACYRTIGREDPCPQCAATRVLATGFLQRVERTLGGEEGRPRRISLVASPVFDAVGRIERVLVIIQELPVSGDADPEEAERERLAGLGLLTAGIVHNLNNILGSLAGNADLALLYPEDRKVAVKALKVITRDSERAAGVLRRVSQAAKGIAPGPAADLAEVFEHVMHRMEPEAEARCLTVVRQFTSVPAVACDPWALRRLLMAVVRGAIFAARPGSEVVVSLARRPCRGQEPSARRAVQLRLQFARSPEVPAQSCACPLNLEELPEEARADESLSLAEELAGRLGGSVRHLKCELDSRVTVTVPIADDLRQAGSARDDLRAGQDFLRVLVVDDEECIRHIMTLMLEADGQRVESAADGEQAVARCAAEHFDVVFLDLMLPGSISGAETLERLRRCSPATRIVLMTGRGRDADTVRCMDRADATVLKPFYRQEVLDALHA